MKSDRRYGLLGRVLGHSYSPQIHAMLGEYPYDLFACEEEELSQLFSRDDLGGINVTIPYKKTVMPFCDSLTEAAQAIGCVNTIVWTPNGTVGDNTDLDGFLSLIDRAGVELKGLHVVVAGRGASSQTVETACRQRGAARVDRLNREEMAKPPADVRDADVLINATPVGMYPHNGHSAVELRDFPRLRFVGDLVYHPHRTALLLAAEKAGIAHSDGLPMLVGQARAAAEHFTGQNIPKEREEDIVAKLRAETENIVLIGMPGCGKSTVGKALADALRRPFVDLDLAIEQETGRKPGDIITEDGEAAFRKMESEAAARIGKENGQIIATGGGAILDPANVDALRQDGFLVYLTRPIHRLATHGRPLSAGGRSALEQLYAVRDPLYRAAADVAIENDEIERVVKGIEEAFHAHCRH